MANEGAEALSVSGHSRYPETLSHMRQYAGFRCIEYYRSAHNKQ